MRRVLLWGLLALLTASPAHALTIAAASSLRLVMPELEEAFQEQHPGSELRVIFGASGKLATQILNGAPYDVFLSADTAYPRTLAERDAAATEPEVYARGRLVLWPGERQQRLTLAGLASDDIHRVAIAQPRHAPYGQRAREVLEAYGLWQVLQPKLVYGENIGQTAAMVESGAADAGLIAWSLTFTPTWAQRPFTLINDDLHNPLSMAMVLTRHGADHPAAGEFLSFMRSERARTLLGRYGFEAPDKD